MKAYRSEEFGPNGKRLLVFNFRGAVQTTKAMEIPCGNCMGCRLEKARQWAVRLNHERKLHEHACFLTLTYDQQHVPTNYGLDLRHWQLFMKRLRFSLDYPVRFFACGEYGDRNGRPHYHALIFGHDWADKRHAKKNKQGDPIYTSPQLDALWGMGICTTQDVTFKSASYVARYVTKKISTKDEYGANHYRRLSPIDGQWHQVRPEFAVMSRRPGIGHGYVDKFKSDFYPSGFVVADGKPQAVPQYYLKQLSDDERLVLTRKARRTALKYKSERTTERRWARVAVRDARISNLKRDL